jgi:hypothetical protein
MSFPSEGLSAFENFLPINPLISETMLYMAL